MTERDRYMKAGNQLMELQNVMLQCGSNEFDKRSKLLLELIQMWRDAKQVPVLDIPEGAIEEPIPEENEHTPEELIPEETIPEGNDHTPEGVQK